MAAPLAVPWGPPGFAWVAWTLAVPPQGLLAALPAVALVVALVVALLPSAALAHGPVTSHDISRISFLFAFLAILV